MGFSEMLFADPAPARAILRRLIRGLRIGSFGFRYRIGALQRPHYAYILYQAAQLATRLGLPRISAIEFGVAGGNGLLWMERHAERIERIFPVKIDIYGFDTGGGLPEPKDYRDLPYHWQGGFFAMDQAALRARLTRAELVIGEVADTKPAFLAREDVAPIGAVSHDFDFYSSTMEGLALFEGAATRMLPRVYCYFDDTMGSDMELYSDFTGERLAIEDFNRSNAERKLGIPYYLRARQAIGAWVNQIWVCHLFDHPLYNRFISATDQQLPLAGGERG